MASFPDYRPRRLRANENLRRMVRETRLSVDQLILPLFVCPGRRVENPVSSMPGVAQLSVDLLVEKAKGVRDLGIPAVILFGIPEEKDEAGSEAYDPNGIVQRAVRALKEEVDGLTVITDVCLCEYTDHGHCGVVVDDDVDNDSTLDLLGRELVRDAVVQGGGHVHGAGFGLGDLLFVDLGAVHRHGARRLDADLDATGGDLDDRDANMVGDDDLFADLAGEHEHGWILPVSTG